MGEDEFYDVLIVGAGHAAAQLAATLRQRGFEGSVAMVGDEEDPPYERPPLSKEYLAGEREFSRLLIRPETFWSERRVDLLLGRLVVSVDPDHRMVTAADRSQFGYRRLVWATGGSPRRLTCSGHHLKGVHGIRARADVDRMVAELETVQRVVVIGGGYIGLEAAAVLTKLGKHVIVLEAQNRVLARVAGEELSRFYEEEHRRHGVEVRLDCTVECIEERDGSASGVRLSDGSVLPCEMVVVGIGIIPAVKPILDAGAIGANGGVLVDEFCRTTLPDVYAIGDCAAHLSRYADDTSVRLESVQNANDQATTVAKHLTGNAASYDAVPWFWSNQFDLKLQTVGLSGGYDATVVRGDPATRSFSVIYLRGGRVVALDCVNSVRDYVQGRVLVTSRAKVLPALLADQSIPLKELHTTTER